MDGGLLTLLCQEDCFLIPICAAVSSLRLQRATQLSTPGLPLDRFSLWTTCMGSGTSVHGSGHSGNPEGNHTRRLEFLWGFPQASCLSKGRPQLLSGGEHSPTFPQLALCLQTCVVSVSPHCHSSMEMFLSTFQLFSGTSFWAEQTMHFLLWPTDTMSLTNLNSRKTKGLSLF